MTPPTLREICERATKGPWVYQPCPNLTGQAHPVHADNEDNEMVCECYEGTEEQQAANAQLIARLDPGTVLAILDALESCHQGPTDFEGCGGMFFNASLVKSALQRLNGKRT